MFRGIRWGGSERGRLRWEEARKVGKLRFLIVHSLLIRGGLLFAGAILYELFIWHKQLSLHLIEADAFVCFIGALILGLWSWDQNEVIHRAFQIAPIKPGQLGSEMTQKRAKE